MFRSITQLEAYYWVARLGSFQAAAERLGLTQPSISIRIKALEKEAGTRLFIRDGQGARLTERGRAMFDHVERVIGLLSDLDGQFGHADPLRGYLRLGVPDSFALCCLSPLMELLDQHHPELSTTVIVDNSHNLSQRLEESRLDLAIIVRPEVSSAFRVESLGYQSLTWVASPSCNLPRRVLYPGDLNRQRIFTNPSPSPSFAVLMDWFANDGLIPSRVNTCNNIAAIVLLIASGQGVTTLPVCVAQKHLRDGTLMALETTPSLPAQEMFAAYPRTAMNRGVKQIALLIREAIRGTGFVE